MVSLPLLVLGGFTAFAFVVGVIIGVVGIGGVLLIPFLVYVGGIDIHTVIPACMAGFIICGWVATYIYARKGSVRWDKAVRLIAGAAPGAYLGSITVWALPPIVLEWVVAAFVVASGVNTLRKGSDSESAAAVDLVPSFALVALGFVVGYGSSVSGTGGPLLLVPSLLLLNFPTLTAVGLSMAIQLVIAPFATLGHIVHGTIDWVLAVPIAVGVASGIVLGAAIAHSISKDALRKCAAITLIVCGLFVAAQIIV